VLQIESQIFILHLVSITRRFISEMKSAIAKTLIFTFLVTLVMPVFAVSNATTNISTPYSIVGQLKLPAGYTISTSIAMPTYIPAVDSIYVFATKATQSFLLVLSGKTGALKASPLSFGPLSLPDAHFVYDSKNGVLFASELLDITNGYRIVGISTSTNKVVANFTAQDGSLAIAYDSFNNEIFSTGCLVGSCPSAAGYVDLFNAASHLLVARIPTRPSGVSFVATDSMIYDSNNHAVYVEYNGQKGNLYFDQIAVIQGNSHFISTRMTAPNVSNSVYGFGGGNLVFDPTRNVLFDSQPQSSSSIPFAGFNAFDTTTNTLITPLLSTSFADVNQYDAGRQTVHGNYVIASGPCCAESVVPSSSELSILPPYGGVTIPAIKPGLSEACYQTLSSAAFGASFADCQSWNFLQIPVGPRHMDILSASSGALLGRVTDPSAIVSGQKVFYPLVAFGDNAVGKFEYAVGDGSATIYEIST
jgi:hypothetical protein